MTRIGMLLLFLAVPCSNKCYANGTENFKITKIKNNLGFYYENVGNLKIFNDQWKLLIHLDTEDIKEQYKRVETLHNKLILLCTNLVRQNIDDTECKNIIPHIDQLINILQTQNKQISNILGSKTDMISKRGVLNIVGTISKELFGTLDENDRKYYDEQIKILYENEQHVHNLLKQQTTVRESVINHINKTIDYMTELDSKISKSLLKLNKIENATNAVQHISTINEIFVMFISLTDRYLIVQTHVLDILNSALRGNLHPYVISTSDLLKELVKIQTSLPNDVNLPTKLNMINMKIFYKIIDTKVYYSNKRLNFLLTIPLTKTIEFRIFKMTSIPQKLNNKAYTILVPEKQFLVIDSPEQHYFLIDTTDLRECSKTTKDNYICEQKEPIHISHINSACERALFDPVSTIPKSCIPRVMIPSHTIYLQLAQRNSWLSIAPQNERLILQCKKAMTHQVILNGTSILELNEGCEARSDTIILSSKSVFNSEIAISHFYYIPELPKLEISANQIETLKNFDSNNNNYSTFQISDQIRSLHKISLKLSELNNYYVPLRKIQSHSNHLISITTVIAIIIFVIVLEILRRLLAKFYNRKKTELELNSRSYSRPPTPKREEGNTVSEKGDPTEIYSKILEPKPIQRGNNTLPRYNFRSQGEACSKATS